MSDVSLGGGQKNKVATPEQQKQKMIYLDIPTAITMILELGDSKNIKKYANPIVVNIKQAFPNKQLRKVLCTIFGVKSARKFEKLKPEEFKVVTNLFGDIWGLKK